MQLLNSDAQKEASNRTFGGDHRAAVEEVAEPPAVRPSLNAFDREILVMPASAEVYTDDGRRSISHKRYLPVLEMPMFSKHADTHCGGCH